MRLLIIIMITSYFSLALAQVKYNRKLYGGWVDMDKDRQNTRQEVLIEENLSNNLILSKDGTKVISGMWICFFSGDTIYDPSKLDIDHVVPLKEAHYSGAWEWTRKEKKIYANHIHDPVFLRAVKASENRRKGAKDPCGYLPPINKCKYLNDWIYIKKTTKLIFDYKEFKCILKARKKYCN